MRVLGIDPGSRITGYGFIEVRAGKLCHVDNGGIFPPAKLALKDRIHFIYQELKRLVAEFSPDMAALEDIFVAKNASSSLKLGQARGASVVAVLQAGIPLHEYSANQVKLAITGYGHASKEQMQRMVQTLLKLPDLAFTDASDALAVAICHSHSHRMLQKVKSA